MQGSVFVRGSVVICTMIMLVAGMALANPIPVGTVNVNFLPSAAGASQGSISGYFSVNSTGAILGYDLQVTQSADCCGFSTGLPAFSYAPSNAGAISVLGSLANGNQYLYFHGDHTFAGGDGSNLVFNFDCGGVTNCFTNNIADGNSFSVSILEYGMPDFLPSRTTGNVFLNVTDPAGVFSFNVDSVATGNLIGGGGTPVPEPSSLYVLGTGIAGIAAALRRRLKK